MFNFIKAENLKCHRTFAKKLAIIAPLFMILLAYANGQYFVQNGYNWWYSIIIPGVIALMSALINQYEDKKLHYRNVFSLPLSLEKVWISKVLLISGYLTIASIIHLLGMIVGKFLYNTASQINILQMIAATFVIIITSLWEVPLCLFISKKLGFAAAIIVNVAFGIVFSIITATKTFWFVCPFCYTTRLMCPILGILPNGELAKSGNALLNTNVILIGILISALLFIVITALTAKWFSKQEAK